MARASWLCGALQSALAVVCAPRYMHKYEHVQVSINTYVHNKRLLSVDHCTTKVESINTSTKMLARFFTYSAVVD